MEPNYNHSKNKFRNRQNLLLTKDLFIEESRRPEQALFSLDREGREGYIHLYKEFMEMEDLTGFEFAVKFFESYQHWKKICATDWFAQHYSEWTEELELKIRAKSLKFLISKSKESTDVAKYLLNNRWVENAQKGNEAVNHRGRPSKQQIKDHLKLITLESQQVDEDYERILA